MFNKIKSQLSELGLEKFLVKMCSDARWPKKLFYFSRIDLFVAEDLDIPQRALSRMEALMKNVQVSANDELEQISTFWCQHTPGLEGQAGGLEKSLRQEQEKFGLKIYRHKGEQGIQGLLCVYTRERHIPMQGLSMDRLTIDVSKDVVCLGYGLIDPKWRMSRLFASMMKSVFNFHSDARFFVADVSPLNTRSRKTLESIGFMKVLDVMRVRIFWVLQLWVMRMPSGKLRFVSHRHWRLEEKVLEQAVADVRSLS